MVAPHSTAARLVIVYCREMYSYTPFARACQFMASSCVLIMCLPLSPFSFGLGVWNCRILDLEVCPWYPLNVWPCWHCLHWRTFEVRSWFLRWYWCDWIGPTFDIDLWWLRWHFHDFYLHFHHCFFYPLFNRYYILWYGFFSDLGVSLTCLRLDASISAVILVISQSSRFCLDTGILASLSVISSTCLV